MKPRTRIMPRSNVFALQRRRFGIWWTVAKYYNLVMARAAQNLLVEALEK
jgi:hypothetical protein